MFLIWSMMQYSYYWGVKESSKKLATHISSYRISGLSQLKSAIYLATTRVYKYFQKYKKI